MRKAAKESRADFDSMNEIRVESLKTNSTSISQAHKKIVEMFSICKSQLNWGVNQKKMMNSKTYSDPQMARAE
jgi:hypothetical protein